MINLRDIKISRKIKFQAIKNKGYLPKECICKNGDDIHNFRFSLENNRYSRQVCKNCGKVMIFRKPINSRVYNNYKFRDLVQSRERTKDLFEYVYGREKLKHTANTNQRVMDSHIKERDKEINDYETKKEATDFIKKYYI